MQYSRTVRLKKKSLITQNPIFYFKNMIKTRKKSASGDIWCGTAIILLIVAVAPRKRRVSRNENAGHISGLELRRASQEARE